MGCVNAGYLEPAGKHVLNLLKEKGTVRYGGTYYDISDEQMERVRKEMGFTEEDDATAEDMTYPPIIVDWAVGQMEKRGLVTTKLLPEEMSDGEPDYMITLTDEGRAFIESRQAFKHWDMDL